jgi:hypothetical protein
VLRFLFTLVLAGALLSAALRVFAPQLVDEASGVQSLLIGAWVWLAALALAVVDRLAVVRHRRAMKLKAVNGEGQKEAK